MNNIWQSKKWIILTTLIFIIIALSLLFRWPVMNQNTLPVGLNYQSNQAPTPTIIVLPGKITLTVDPANTNSQQVVLQAYLDSGGQLITAFDIDLRYSTEKFKLKQVDSLIADYDVRKTDIITDPTSPISELIITGTTLPSEQSKQFVNKLVAKIVFTKQKSDVKVGDIKLFFTPQSTNDSNLINTNNQDVLGSVVGPN